MIGLSCVSLAWANTLYLAMGIAVRENQSTSNQVIPELPKN
jgi:hypothetical protein